MRALVLSGGGSRGAFQAGALKYLLEKEQDREWYKVFCGISVGAINCAYLAQHNNTYDGVTGLLALWNKLTDDQVKSSWFPFGRLSGLWKTSFYNTAPLRKLLDARLTPERIKLAGNKLRVGAVGLSTGEYRLFTQRYRDLHSAIMASAAFPTMFPPVRLDGQLWTDGGVRNVTPLKSAIDCGDVDEIDIVVCSNLGRKFERPEPTNTLEVGLQVFETLLDEILNEDIEKAKYYNEAIATGKLKGSDKKIIKLRIVQPIEPLPGTSLDFNNKDALAMIDIGYRSAKERLA